MSNILHFLYTPNSMAKAWYGNLRNRQNSNVEAWEKVDEPMRFTKPVRGENK